MSIKWITVAYILFLLIVIALVNLGDYNELFQLVYLLPYGDKVAHFLLMGGLAFLVNVSLRGTQVKFGRRQFFLGSLIVLAIVTFEEFTQLFVTTRTFDLGDLGCDYAGIWMFGQLAKYFI